LQTPFLALEHLAKDVPYRVAMAPRGALQWPWESMHVEALAWFDQWLKGHETGIMDGKPIRYFVEGADEWREADTWPLPDTRYDAFHLCADGTLSSSEKVPGSRDYLYLPKSLNRPLNANAPSLPARLSWTTEPFAEAVDIVGPAQLRLSASSSAVDTDWIVKLQDIAPDGGARDLTQGWLRASHRAIDAERSKPYRPEHGHDRAEPLVPGAALLFEIAILPTAQRFAAGHRLGISIASADDDGFAMQGMTHTGLGMPAHNRIFSASHLIVPVVPPA
jgi:hypothetical protein